MMHRSTSPFWVALVLLPSLATAQVPEPPKPPAEPVKPEPEKTPAEKAEPEKPWYEKLSLRGYAQTRFNRLYVTDDEFQNQLGDRASAPENSFSLRRARLVVSGDVAPYLSIYLQVDAANAAVAMRDWYGDVYLDSKQEFRFRVGQSKLPYGWENLQSSQNRAPLDRTDALNSGVPGERELGVFAYWAPEEQRKLLDELANATLKGSGEYGVVGVGVYSGQLINALDANDNRHVFARVAYPFRAGSQILEVGGGGYIGKFNVTKEVDTSGRNNFRDARAFATFVLYPQPIGFQAEYTIGRGPEFDLPTQTVQTKALHGGYAMAMLRVGDFFPYVRAAYYDGGIKSQTDAPRSQMKELVIGSEWRWKKLVELTAEIDIANRRLDGVGACEAGVDEPDCIEAMVRVQAQLNY